MLHWGLLLVAVTCVTGEDVKVGDKWVKFINREELRASKTWSLSADAGSTVKMFCPDARFPGGNTEEELCRWSKLVLDDGVEKRSLCGTQYDFHVTSKSSKLNFEVILPEGSAGILECLAKAVHPPKSYEEVKVAPDGVKRFKFPEVLGEDIDKAWRFKSITDKKISLQCQITSERELGGVCVRDIITVDNGEGQKKQCGYDDLVTISSDKEITLRVETYPTSEARVDCKVQAISGPSPNEHENIQITESSEIDSSEIGVVPGKKSTTCDCGRTNQQSSRIINGTEVTHESKFPFMVSLRSLWNDHFCGASIISPVHILTAAHCVSDSKTKSEPVPKDLMPTVGAHSSQDSSHGETQKLRVKKVSIPDEWFAVKGGLGGDIAIIHLETPIRFSKWVGPVCLTPNEPPIVNTYIKAMGWGATEKGNPDILREANVQVLDKAVCFNNPKEVCFKSGPSASCFGDSGGPYVWADPETNRYTQVALVSYGFSACNGDIFVGTNTVHWYDWIQKTMAETSTEHGICKKQD